MSHPLQEFYDEMMKALGVEGLEIPLTAVTFFQEGQAIPESVLAHGVTDLTLTACQASRQASLGDAVCLTRENMGCVAGAISLGMVAKDDPQPFSGPRVYTDLMKIQSADQDTFAPPAPKDFTDGIVYACRDAGRPDFCLFGPEDSGRYQDIQTAGRAVEAMARISPPMVRAVFFYSLTFEEERIKPDVILLSVRPVELTRLLQGHQFITGRPTLASMGGLRAVCSDLIAYVHVNQTLNISPYCLGARLIARYEAQRVGLGIPYGVFQVMIEGLKKSRTGYPFHRYPGV